jgi:hypothetical protein
MSKNVITLRSWASKMKEYHFQPCRQKNGARLPFVKPVRYDAMGNAELVLSPDEMNDPNREYFIAEDADIVVTDGTTFDLDDPLQRNKWEAIKNSDLIVPTRDYKLSNGDYAIDGSKKRYGIAELWVDIPGEESERNVSKIKKLTEAYTYIGKDSKQGRLTRCKLLGKYMENAPDSDVEEYLYQEAQRNPDVILELYKSSDMALKLLLIDAKQKGIIIKNNGMYVYGEAILGATDDAVIIFFKTPANKPVVDQITFETYPEYAPVNKLEEKIEEAVPKEEKLKKSK